MTALFLSRACLRRDASVAALARLLVPDAAAARMASAHHLVWSLFADGPDRRRDFLWREERPGRYLTLSARLPADPHGLFDLDDPKPFEPDLAPGDRLAFMLRANPVVARSDASGKRGRRHDVVMDALHRMPSGERAAARPGAIVAAGSAWLARQGEAHGFASEDGLNVDGYETVRLLRDRSDRGERPEPIRFGVLDISGVLTVHEPDRFLAALATGFGRSRAFGCGLMLIRRAPHRE
jgi:CRISPR system Cascade subunit CasE